MGNPLFSLWITIFLLFAFSNVFAARSVTDTIAPEIVLNGKSHVIIEVGNQHYQDAGVTTTDNTKGAITVTTFSEVNTTKAGIYTVTYIAKDASGNRAKAIRSVEVIDKIPPKITLNGSEVVVIEVGSDYSDLGVTCTDNSSGAIRIMSNISIDSKTVGEYVVNYTAIDQSGNQASISRKVVVAELNDKPVIPVSTSDDNDSISIDKPKTEGAGGSFSFYGLWMLSIVFIAVRRKD